MAQLSDDCFAAGDALMPLDEALALIGQRLEPVVGHETVALTEASGRVLAEDVVSAIQVPPNDNSAVDGYAFRFADLARASDTTLAVVGRAGAGHPFDGPVPPGAAVRIFTGAPMPADCDTVLMQEDARLAGADVVVPPGLKAGANRRMAGEDITKDQLLLKAGRRLGAADLGVAAAAGRAELSVFAPLKVALFSTGDELCEPGRPLAPGAIHDSNRHVLRALLARLGAEVDDLGILPDDARIIRAALAEAAAEHHLILTSGGVSVGEEDHVRDAVEKLGNLHLWRLAIKPGRPVALGQIGAAAFAGLPGNPVAVVLTFIRVVRPMIEILSGAEPRPPLLYSVRSGFDYRKKRGRREWVRVRLGNGDDGAPVAHKFPRQGAGILMSVVDSDGVLELPEEMEELKAGDMAPYLSFSEAGA